MPAKISASIVTYNTDVQELYKCLDSLILNGITSIFIIDNSPNDNLKTFCSPYSCIKYVFNNKNIGYGAGHNIAIREAIRLEFVYHLVINSDVYFGKDIISSITYYMDKNLDVAQLIPNVTYPNGNLQYVCRLLPNPQNLIFRRFFPEKVVEKMNYKYCLKFNDHTEPINIPYLQGSFMFFRVSCFNKVGLFDERFFMYPKDIDITRRMHKFFRTMYWPEVTIIHAHRSESYKNNKMLKIHMINMIKYFNKWGWILDRDRKVWNKQLLEKLGFDKKNEY